jgi:hypothetical protein
VVEDVLVGFEDAVREPVVAHELPDVLDRVELRAFGWQRDERDVVRHHETAGQMPPGLIEEKHGMVAGRHLRGDLGEVHAHRLGIAGRQDEACALAVLGANGAEDLGRGRALIQGRRWPGPAPSPAARDLVLLADTRLVGEPDLYTLRREALLLCDCVQAGGEAFLKSSIAPSAWAW